ncbi:hypothetical protein GUJ93_ZPchr0009g599 [Zizania palustris]|uniref:Uncharacterized protein n=1 Tax=Zizania palustris TaxID=103762 RepID=A0A8J5VKM3_ZIZPA|nr:hypothetical protein GUJ93_ZPchr0009g599 [Zizania palustris]
MTKAQATVHDRSRDHLDVANDVLRVNHGGSRLCWCRSWLRGLVLQPRRMTSRLPRSPPDARSGASRSKSGLSLLKLVTEGLM